VRKNSSNKIIQTKARKIKILSNNKKRTKEFSITFLNTQKLILSWRKNCQSDGSSIIVIFLLALYKK
jgi:hypothetical protein